MKVNMPKHGLCFINLTIRAPRTGVRFYDDFEERLKVVRTYYNRHAVNSSTPSRAPLEVRHVFCTTGVVMLRNLETVSSARLPLPDSCGSQYVPFPPKPTRP